MKRSVLKTNFKKSLLLIAVGITSLVGFAQSGPGGGSGNSGPGNGGSNNGGGAPELVFQNPVLISGTANKQGAVYKFANVATGVDAQVKLKKFSKSTIVMNSVDNNVLGWAKAFQPEFGLPGLVQPNQNWYIDFELSFFEAGTNKKQKMQAVDLTALDVDGDGNSISEYVTFNNPKTVSYSTVSYLAGNPAGTLGQVFTCDSCGLSSILIPCILCGGDGQLLGNDCLLCDGTGKIFTLCHHPYEAGSGTIVSGPVENFTNIDTLATQVMSTYHYENVDKITFRYGAKSGALASNGSGIRLNSTWFREFSLEPAVLLPVKMTNFYATSDKTNVTLDWTANEQNFSNYIVQRSTDGKTYSDIALVFAAGTDQMASYKFKDVNVSSPTGMLFYRLQLVDRTKEGAKYSDVRVIRLGKEQESLQLTTYPNPVKEQVRITLPSAWQGKPVMIELFTANGTRIQGMQLSSASQTESLQLGKISNGFYLVKATCENQVAQQRIVKN